MGGMVDLGRHHDPKRQSHGIFVSRELIHWEKGICHAEARIESNSSCEFGFSGAAGGLGGLRVLLPGGDCAGGKRQPRTCGERANRPGPKRSTELSSLFGQPVIGQRANHESTR